MFSLLWQNKENPDMSIHLQSELTADRSKKKKKNHVQRDLHIAEDFFVQLIHNLATKNIPT